jgi:cobaltochelatase CobS
LDYLPKKKEVEIIKAKVDNITDKLADYMVQFAGLVRVAYAQGNVSFTMSPRTLLSWGEKAIYYKSIKQALKVSYYGKLPNDSEKVAIEEMYATVFAERFR